MRTHSRNTLFAAAASIALLAACHEGNEIEDTDAPSATGSTDAAEPLAQDLLGALETRPQYSTLVSAIQSARLADRLNGDQPVTLFAPTNEAFDALPATRLEQLIQLSNRAELRRLLEAHIVGERLGSAEIEAAIEAGDGSATFETIGGGTLTIVKQGEGFRMTAPGGNRATIAAADIAASNGVVHGVDAVLQPAEVEDGALADEPAN